MAHANRTCPPRMQCIDDARSSISLFATMIRNAKSSFRYAKLIFSRLLPGMRNSSHKVAVCRICKSERQSRRECMRAVAGNWLRD